jgi:hypothetical protein
VSNRSNRLRFFSSLDNGSLLSPFRRHTLLSLCATATLAVLRRYLPLAGEGRNGAHRLQPPADTSCRAALQKSKRAIPQWDSPRTNQVVPRLLLSRPPAKRLPCGESKGPP